MRMPAQPAQYSRQQLQFTQPEKPKPDCTTQCSPLCITKLEQVPRGSQIPPAGAIS